MPESVNDEPRPICATCKKVIEREPNEMGISSHVKDGRGPHHWTCWQNLPAPTKGMDAEYHRRLFLGSYLREIYRG